MTEPRPEEPAVADEPDADPDARELPDADDAPDRPEWVPPRIPDFEEGPHVDQ